MDGKSDDLGLEQDGLHCHFGLFGIICKKLALFVG